MAEVLYRFRSLHNLLDGHQELENQEIYFASPEQLNDPMEGFKDIYWSGDNIVWENLLKHYLLCLEHCCSLVIICGDTMTVTGKDIPVFKTPESFPTPLYASMYGEICDHLQNDATFSDLALKLSQRKNKIRKNELIFHLSRFHRVALDSIFSVYEKHNLLPKGSIAKNNSIQQLPDNLDFIEMLNKSEEQYPETEYLAETFCHVQSLISLQSSLMLRFNNKTEQISHNNRLFIFSHFPEAYVNEIEKLVYPGWYAACFMSECSNSSLWGHYGDNHKGVCLIFNTSEKNGHKSMLLNRTIGFGNSGPIRGTASHQFFEVDYERAFVEIDFFRSLGTLPIPVLTKYWYSNQDGVVSRCADDILSDQDTWRAKYWQDFMYAITSKKKDWQFEQEYRLLLNEGIINFDEPEERKLKYRFNDLIGIIFGINTPINDKMKIIRIINNKCKEGNRQDFKFYQAYFSRKKGIIDHMRLSLLRFEEAAEKQMAELST